MKVEKQIFEEFEKLYAQTVIFKEGKPAKYFAGAEAEGSCTATDAADGSKKTVWDGPGGTMTICQINDKGDFYANEKFFPIFHAPECIIVHGTETEEGYDITEVQKIPYVHRFDVVQVGDDQVFVGATLAKFKEDKDDWSKPGEVIIGKLNEDPTQPMELKVILEGVTKNHGFCTTTYQGKRVILITGVEGLFCVELPEKFEDEWVITQLLDREISDACVVDFDNDGEDEIVTIEKFHGNELIVNKLVDGIWTKVFEKEVAFGHGLWGGNLLGKNRFIAGWRQGSKELICFTKEGDEMTEFVLGDGGTSQFSVWQEGNEAFVLSADRQAKGQIGQLVLYKITE
ncbi:MAG: hypothetical protein R3Y40_07795 [Eubacteriales bacterium]